MSLSTMTSREKTIVAILAVVIVLALIGIGVLAAQLIDGDDADEAIVVADTPTSEAPGAQATVTLVPPPSLEQLAQTTPLPKSSQPVVVVRQEAVGPLAPVIIADQPLHAGHRYRLEITAGGAKVAIQGSWGQSATSASGQVAAPQIEFFEGRTPYRIEIISPVPDPELWSCSASAGLKAPNLLEQSPNLVITIWDVTGTQ